MRNRELRISILAVALGLLLIGGSALAYVLVTSGAPASVVSAAKDAVSTQDSGIAACEEIRDNAENPDQQTDSETFATEEEYQQTRKLFADSSHEDIRTHGTAVVDLAWQMQGTDDTAAFAFIGPFIEAWSGLVGACAAHGIVIPPVEFGESGA